MRLANPRRARAAWAAGLPRLGGIECSGVVLAGSWHCDTYPARVENRRYGADENGAVWEPNSEFDEHPPLVLAPAGAHNCEPTSVGGNLFALRLEPFAHHCAPFAASLLSRAAISRSRPVAMC